MQSAKITIIVAVTLIAITAAISSHAAIRPIHYSFTITNTGSTVAKEVHFWTYAPIGQSSLQISAPYQLITDDLGNQILHFTFNNIPPYAARIISIEAGINPAGRDNQDTKRYLIAEPFCEADDPAIRALAKELRGSTARQTVENIYKWVSANVRYAGYLKNPRGALYALKHKEGDCTEYMYLFVALCRADKIPARGIGGYLANGNPVLKPDAYHNWAECYIDGAWQLIDPQKKVFMPEPARYIALHIIGDAPKNPIAGPYKFAYKGEGIQIEMNR
ncbi:MAG: transglutaminase-like domain-containing protein [Deltaproteobacteria bacterium]|nr:transglutaminase-like domain-containing protein [Deltaproteobacteria bacterium]